MILEANLAFIVISPVIIKNNLVQPIMFNENPYFGPKYVFQSKSIVFIILLDNYKFKFF